MESIFADYTFESNVFDNALAKADVEFREAITEFVEALYSPESYITEAEKDTFIVKVKKFFADLISSFKMFMKSIKTEVGKAVRTASTDNELHKMYNQLKKKKAEGVKNVKVMDVWTLQEAYVRDAEDLMKLAKKFSNKNYKTVIELENDIADFNTKFDRYEKELEELEKKVVTVSIDKMIAFVEAEISNRSKIFDTMNDCITMMETMKGDCENMETKVAILGPDIIQKKISFIRKIGLKISGFVKKIIVKIVSTTVFLFA